MSISECVLLDVLQGRPPRPAGGALVPYATCRWARRRPALQLNRTEPTGGDYGLIDLAAAVEEVAHQHESNDVDQSL
ncbi:hypothetical protein G6F24_015715 [Rhizopus arrhizus]|nr:hypothetical protein G6F24_015715 [Rhizopus arrhizus]